MSTETDLASDGRRAGASRSARGLARRGALTIGCCCAALGFGAVAATASSSSIALKETASLKRVGKAKGFDLTEKGTAGGSLKGSIDLSLHVVSTNEVTASVSVYPKGGALYGSGSASYHVHGAYAEFSGTLSITKGSGSWSGAHGSNLKFSGKIERSNDNVSVSLSGALYK
jgi:hypothetical protein